MHLDVALKLKTPLKILDSLNTVVSQLVCFWAWEIPVSYQKPVKNL